MGMINSLAVMAVAWMVMVHGALLQSQPDSGAEWSPGWAPGSSAEESSPRLDAMEAPNQHAWRSAWQVGEHWTERHALERAPVQPDCWRCRFRGIPLAWVDLRYLVRKPDRIEELRYHPNALVLEVTSELIESDGTRRARSPVLITFDPDSGDVLRVLRLNLEKRRARAVRGRPRQDLREVAGELLADRCKNLHQLRWPPITGVNDQGEWFLGPSSERLGVKMEPGGQGMARADYSLEEDPRARVKARRQHEYTQWSPWYRVVDIAPEASHSNPTPLPDIYLTDLVDHGVWTAEEIESKRIDLTGMVWAAKPRLTPRALARP